MRDWALLAHLIGAFSFVAGVVLAGVAFEAGRRRQRPQEVALLLRLTRVGVAFVVAGAVLVLGFGLWLVDLSGFGFGSGWIDASLALFVLALALGALGGQRPKRARRLAEALAERGEDAGEELRALLADRASRLANYSAAAAVVAILALMVFKP